WPSTWVSSAEAWDRSRSRTVRPSTTAAVPGREAQALTARAAMSRALTTLSRRDRTTAGTFREHRGLEIIVGAGRTARVHPGGAHLGLRLGPSRRFRPGPWSGRWTRGVRVCETLRVRTT